MDLSFMVRLIYTPGRELGSMLYCIIANMIVFEKDPGIMKDVMQIDIHKRRKNITRFTYEFTSFQGWRVTLCRRQEHFTRYFSDKQYGSAEAGEAAVERFAG